MNYRSLGATGIKVSAVGYGCWGIGGNAGGAVAYGPTRDEDSIQALERALELGVNFFDTADLYGYGHSEELLGRVLAPRRERVVIATKVGLIEGGRGYDFSRKHILETLTASLRRLRSDYIDLYQLHNPSLETLDGRDSPLGVMEELLAQGKIRAFGVSLRSPEDGLAVVGHFPVGCVQVNFNLTDQRAVEQGLFKLCAEKNVGVIVRSPLVAGFLTGRYTGTKSFGEFDQRRSWSAEQIRRWNQAEDFFAVIMARYPEDTPAQFALRFCLSFPGVSAAIPGMLTAAHVEENVVAGGYCGLAEEDIALLFQKYKSVEFFVKG